MSETLTFLVLGCFSWEESPPSKGQSEKSGGQINTNSSEANASVGGARPKSNQPGPYLPPGHENYARINQQRMTQVQPGPVEMSNIFNILGAIGGEMPAFSQ